MAQRREHKRKQKTAILLLVLGLQLLHRRCDKSTIHEKIHIYYYTEQNFYVSFATANVN